MPHLNFCIVLDREMNKFTISHYINNNNKKNNNSEKQKSIEIVIKVIEGKLNDCYHTINEFPKKPCNVQRL